MNTIIDIKYELDCCVSYLELNLSNGTWENTVGYIVGFKYTTHPYLETPIVEYAVLEEGNYKDYKESLANGETPFKWRLSWVKEDDIISKVD